MEQIVQPFSAGYFMLNTNVLPHSGEAVIMPRDLYSELGSFVTRPLLRISDGHYWPRAEKTVPADTIAIPRHLPRDANAPLLMAKDDTAARLIETGAQRNPPT